MRTLYVVLLIVCVGVFVGNSVWWLTAALTGNNAATILHGAITLLSVTGAVVAKRCLRQLPPTT